MNGSLSPLLWFAAIVAMIPLALWLLKRTPLGGASAGNVMRTVAALPLSPNQRLLTVEVGQGEDRRWLVLGVSPGSITTLHTLPPQAEADSAGSALPAGAHPAFAQILGRLQRPGGGR
jgi:flagellar protein FliO/FliZ